MYTLTSVEIYFLQSVLPLATCAVLLKLGISLNRWLSEPILFSRILIQKLSNEFCSNYFSSLGVKYLDENCLQCCFSLSCKANARVYLAKMGRGPHSSLIVLFHVLIVLFMYCFCVNVYYCHRVSTQLQLNISYHISFTRVWKGNFLCRVIRNLQHPR